MDTFKDGGPAFPLENPRHLENGELFKQFTGMSMRDWFAGQALPSMLNELYASSVRRNVKYENVFIVAADAAYGAADAMLVERNKIASPAGETIRSAQDEAMEASPVTAQPAVGEASPSIAERVRNLIADMVGFEVENVPDTASWKDLNCDSLDTVELVMAIEQQFGIEVPDRDAETLLIVGDAIRYVEKAKGGGRG